MSRQASGMFKKDRDEKWIPVGELMVKFREAQRDLNERKRDRIADNFDPYAVGRIQVARVNGHYHIVDGQHRVAAVQKLWGDDEMVPCDVIPAESAAEAAELFLKVNDERSPVQAIDRFRIAVEADRDEYVEVNDLLTGLGYNITTGAEDGAFAAVSSAMGVYRKHGTEVLKDALLIIQATWGMNRDSVHTSLVQGFSELVAEYGKVIERGRLVDRVAKEYTPARLIGAAKTAREMFRGTVAANVVRVLVSTYNHGLRTGERLEEPGY